MKHLHLIRKKLLPLFISAVVMASQIPVVAADYSDAEIEVGEELENENGLRFSKLVIKKSQ